MRSERRQRELTPSTSYIVSRGHVLTFGRSSAAILLALPAFFPRRESIVLAILMRCRDPWPAVSRRALDSRC